jgi:hypothetical protein
VNNFVQLIKVLRMARLSGCQEMMLSIAVFFAVKIVRMLYNVVRVVRWSS